MKGYVEPDLKKRHLIAHTVKFMLIKSGDIVY